MAGGVLELGEGCPFSTCKYILENSWAPAYVWSGYVPTLKLTSLYSSRLFPERVARNLEKA